MRENVVGNNRCFRTIVLSTFCVWQNSFRKDLCKLSNNANNFSDFTAKHVQKLIRNSTMINCNLAPPKVKPWRGGYRADNMPIPHSHCIELPAGNLNSQDLLFMHFGWESRKMMMISDKFTDIFAALLLSLNHWWLSRSSCRSDFVKCELRQKSWWICGTFL